MTKKAHNLLLWICSGAFLCRVLGQVLVVSGKAPWLPPMEHWQSGLLPYPVLLVCQIAIVLLMAAVNLNLSSGRGFFVARIPKMRGYLFRAAVVYAAVMLLRFTGNVLSDRGPLYDIIPIAFHFVLAFYLFVLSRPAVER